MPNAITLRLVCAALAVTAAGCAGSAQGTTAPSERSEATEGWLGLPMSPPKDAQHYEGIVRRVRQGSRPMHKGDFTLMSSGEAVAHVVVPPGSLIVDEAGGRFKRADFDALHQGDRVEVWTVEPVRTSAPPGVSASYILIRDRKPGLVP